MGCCLFPHLQNNANIDAIMENQQVIIGWKDPEQTTVILVLNRSRFSYRLITSY